MSVAPLLWLSVLGFFPVQALAVFKCTGPGGAVTYQETPCAVGGVRLAADSSTGRAVATSVPSGSGAGPSAAANNRILTAMANGEPAIGMTREQLVQTLGHPQRANLGQYGDSRQDQLIYERPGGTLYVYIRDEKVRSIQNSLGYKSPPKNCPSPLEIRNAETAAGSITLSDDERRLKQRQVERMKRCLD
jgi:hypothetical protein